MRESPIEVRYATLMISWLMPKVIGWLAAELVGHKQHIEARKELDWTGVPLCCASIPNPEECTQGIRHANSMHHSVGQTLM